MARANGNGQSATKTKEKKEKTAKTPKQSKTEKEEFKKKTKIGLNSEKNDDFAECHSQDAMKEGFDMANSNDEARNEVDGFREIEDGMQDYMDAKEKHTQVENGARKNDEDDEHLTLQEESDSSEDEVPTRNTVGNVPLEWYKDEEHIGYDITGRQIKKREKKDQLDSFLARFDDAKDWRKVYDEYNDEIVELTKEELDVIRRLQQGKIPHVDVNPYEPYVDWFEWEDKGHPLSSAPEPKRRFIPSKWEAKKVVKLVRAIRKGWIKFDKPAEKPKYYLLWGDDLKSTDKMANGLARIPAPKPKLPGHDESYNPPVEYIPSEEEINSYSCMDEEDRPKFIPKRHESLRQVPAYAHFINERFERCLDLYLCPRARKKRINIDPESLLPKLPKPRDLEPFPSTCYIEYHGHKGPVTTIAPHPMGDWLASGSTDCSVRIWETSSGRCCKVWDMGKPVTHIAWNPDTQLGILAVAVHKEVMLLNTGFGDEDSKASELLSAQQQKTKGLSESVALVTWCQHDNLPGLLLKHEEVVQCISWHHRGDYFATTAPNANTRSVLIHQLSKQQTQNPFRKLQGRVVKVLFHPSRPFFFVATKTHVRVYNLAKLQLSKKLASGLHEISSMAIHPQGDNLIVGSKDGKLCWFDMDLSVKPYKTLKNHEQDIRSVAFHSSYPLFASCSDDSTAHVFHGMVYSDLLQNPLIVPLKILSAHLSKGVLDCQFHPNQPWLFTAGEDKVIKLFCN